MMSLMNSKVLNIVIMEPSTYVKDSMRILFQENGKMNFKGSVSSFKALEIFLTINEKIDAVLCEMYDHSNNIFEGILKLRQLVKNHPHIKFYLHTSVMYEKLQKQCYITEIYVKKISINDCRFALKAIAQAKCKPVKFPDIETVNDELSTSELKVLISFSHYYDVKRVSISTGLSYKYVSNLKVKIMQKLGIKSNAEFKFMLAEAERNSYNLLKFN